MILDVNKSNELRITGLKQKIASLESESSSALKSAEASNLLH